MSLLSVNISLSSSFIWLLLLFSNYFCLEDNVQTEGVKWSSEDWLLQFNILLILIVVFIKSWIEKWHKCLSSVVPLSIVSAPSRGRRPVCGSTLSPFIALWTIFSCPVPRPVLFCKAVFGPALSATSWEVSGRQSAHLSPVKLPAWKPRSRWSCRKMAEEQRAADLHVCFTCKSASPGPEFFSSMSCFSLAGF